MHAPVRSARHLAAALLAAAVATSGLTVAGIATVAEAAPPAHAASHDNTHNKAKGKGKAKAKAKDRSGHKHGNRYGHKHGHKHGAKSSDSTSTDYAVAKVRATARTLDHLLRNAGSDERLHGLSEDSITAVRANLTADHNALVALVKTVEADPTQAATAYETLRGYAISNYAVAVGQIRFAERMLAYATKYTDYVSTLSTEQQAAYNEALGHLNTALTSARVVQATSNRVGLDVIKNELHTAMNLFAQVRSGHTDNDDVDDVDDDAVDQDGDWHHDHGWDHDWDRHR